MSENNTPTVAKYTYAFVWQRQMMGQTESNLKHGVITADMGENKDEVRGYVLAQQSAEMKGYVLFMHSVLRIDDEPAAPES